MSSNKATWLIVVAAYFAGLWLALHYDAGLFGAALVGVTNGYVVLSWHRHFGPWHLEER